MKKIYILFNVVVFSLVLVSCGGEGELCTVPNISGEPDITGAPYFSASTVSSGDTVTVIIPLDADVGLVTKLTLTKDAVSDYELHSFIGEAVVPGEQNWQYSINTFDMSRGVYHLNFDLCSDQNTCDNGSSGVGVSYGSYFTNESSLYSRHKYWDNGAADEDMDTCIDISSIFIS